MDSHSSHMENEKQGAEREAEAKAIALQQKADLDHLLKNVHPSLHGSISLGDGSNGTTQGVSEYSALILRQEVEMLKEANQTLHLQVDGLRDSVVCLGSELAQLRSEHDTQINLLQQAHTDLKSEIEMLRLKIIPSATPETPVTEELSPHLGAMADEPIAVPAPAPVIEMPSPTVTQAPTVEIPAPTTAPQVQQ